MSEKCRTCEYLEEAPQSAMCSCAKRQISMLEPLELLYMHQPCDEFCVRTTPLPYLDANHCIPNLPEHRIVTIAEREMVAKTKTQWYAALQQRIETLAGAFVDRVRQKYGNTVANQIEILKTDVTTQAAKLWADRKGYSLEPTTKTFLIGTANCYLRSLQCRAWEILKPYIKYNRD